MEKEIETTNGGVAAAEPLSAHQKQIVTALIERAIKEAGLSFEQEHKFRVEFREEYTRWMLKGVSHD